MFKLRRKSDKGPEAPETAAARKGGQQFKIKVRLLDGHKLGISKKFTVFVEPKNNVMEDAEEKIRRLFGS